VFADAIHRSSPRTGRPFLKLNCAALPESILEGELFGYERGAFSGAVVARPGLFESAHGGTVFLDEVGELPLVTQAKLLRVLESGEVLRLGSRTPTQVDVRFISATNRNLEAMIAASTFRRDLYYRLEGVRVVIPPLRDRPEDIIALAEYFLTRLAQRMNLDPPALSESARDSLCAYSWSGNVRELRNIIERAFVMNPTLTELEDTHLLTQTSLGATSRSAVTEPPMEEYPTATNLQAISEAQLKEDDAPKSQTSGDLKASLNAVEREAILDALTKTGGNQSAAARLLGIGRHALIARIESYGIDRPRKK
jgi:two-component system, NtrC family, response regulator AtoC